MPTLTAATELIAASLRNFWRHIGLFARLTLGFGLLAAARWVITSSVGQLYAAGFARTTIQVLAVLPVWIAAAALSVAVIAAASRTLQNRRPTAGECVSIGFGGLFSFLWISFISGLILLGGLLLFIIPALVFIVYIKFAPYALVEDGLRGTAAVSASWRAVSGRFWSVAIRALLPFLFFTVAATLLQALIFLGLGALAGEPGLFFGNVAASDRAHPAASFIATVVPYLVRGFTLPLFVGADLVLWRDLKRTT